MCGEGSSLAPKITWNGDNESDEDFRKNVSAIEVTLEDNPITFADGRENLDAIVLFMPNATMRYGVSEWHALLDDERKPDVRRLLEDMFAQGQDVAYGILFHELFSYCPAVSIDDGNFAAYSYVLHLESRASLSVETIQRCMVSVLHANEEENSIVAGVLEHDKSCHFYIMADIPTIQNSVLASMIHQSETESPRLIVGQDQGSCSFSFLYMGIVDESDHDENEALPPTFWKHVEEASAARAGWIGPENPKKFGRLGVGAGLVRERFEYKRHHETWKQGREPFWIPKITECFY